MTAKTVDAALALEAQKGAERLRSEQVKWFRAGLEAAAKHVLDEYDEMEISIRIRSLPIPDSDHG